MKATEEQKTEMVKILRELTLSVETGECIGFFAIAAIVPPDSTKAHTMTTVAGDLPTHVITHACDQWKFGMQLEIHMRNSLRHAEGDPQAGG